MTVLPWDRYGPETSTETTTPVPVPLPPPKLIEQVPLPPPPNYEPELPYQPPANVPAPQYDWDFKDIIVGAFTEAFDEAKPQLKEQAKGFAQQTISSAIRGDSVDYSVTATTSRGKELVVADARNRSWRTLVQGLVIDLVVALIALCATVFGDLGSTTEAIAWTGVAALFLKTLLQTVFAYFMRIRVTPTIREKGDKVALVPVPEPVVEKIRNYQ